MFVGRRLRLYQLNTRVTLITHGNQALYCHSDVMKPLAQISIRGCVYKAEIHLTFYYYTNLSVPMIGGRASSLSFSLSIASDIGFIGTGIDWRRWRWSVMMVTALDVSWRRPEKISVSRDINPRHLMR